MKKVIVCGPYNSGKTTFVKNINREEFIGTDEPEIDLSSLEELETTTTVGVEVNFVKLANKDVMFVGVPGQFRFDFIWEVIGGQFDGIVFMIPSFSEPEEIKPYIEFFSQLDSYKDAYKLLLLTYPKKAERGKVNRFYTLGLPVRIIDPTDEQIVRAVAFEIAARI